MNEVKTLKIIYLLLFGWYNQFIHIWYGLIDKMISADYPGYIWIIVIWVVQLIINLSMPGAPLQKGKILEREVLINFN